MALVDFVREVEARDPTLTVVNRSEADPVQRMLHSLFDGQAVTVEETETVDDAPSNIVLLETADGSLAVSPLEDVRDSVLFVNSDLYITGARDLDGIETPEVLVRLDELPFSVRGYPDTSKGKFLLIEISRYIEARAYRAGDGRLRAGFQRLSRIDDERGTRRVYDRLTDETEVDVHVYGVPGRTPDLGLAVHGEDCEELRRSWFVVYTNDREPSRNAALVAVKRESNEWDGFWTYTSDRVEAIDDYLASTY